jgi:hypothetical protein
MSVRSLSTLAVERDKAEPRTQAMGGSGGAKGGQVPQQFIDALTSAIPTEPLSAYTAAIGIVAGLKSGSYVGFRWGAFAVFLVVTALALFVSYEVKYRTASSTAEELDQTKKRRFPALEASAALVAAVAWGLAMPGSALNTTLTGDTGAITAAAIIIGGATALSLLTPFLTTGSPTPKPPPAEEESATEPLPVPPKQPAAPEEDPAPPGT